VLVGLLVVLDVLDDELEATARERVESRASPRVSVVQATSAMAMTTSTAGRTGRCTRMGFLGFSGAAHEDLRRAPQPLNSEVLTGHTGRPPRL